MFSQYEAGLEAGQKMGRNSGKLSLILTLDKLTPPPGVNGKDWQVWRTGFVKKFEENFSIPGVCPKPRIDRPLPQTIAGVNRHGAHGDAIKIEG